MSQSTMNNSNEWMQQLARNLADACAKRIAAAAESEKLDSARLALCDRLADAQARYDSALSDLRSGAIDEVIGAARMAVAGADAADLRVLIAETEPGVDAANRAYALASQAVSSAEQAARAAERAAVVDALDQHIAHVEGKLCEAIAERFRLGLEQDGSHWGNVLAKYWKPSEPLRCAVVDGRVPKQGTHS